MANSEEKDLVITRVFDAPTKIVWKAWTDPEHIKLWWAPKGLTSPFAAIDFRVGGKYLLCMRSPEEFEVWSTGVYKEIIPMKRIVCTVSFADANGSVLPPSQFGLPPEFPSELIATQIFDDENGKTKFTFIQHDYPGGPMRENSTAAWRDLLDNLEESLKVKEGK